MPTPPLNGSLENWPDLTASFSKAALLCGNGLSINVWPAFDYGSLFDHAHNGGLTADDLALFGETENFERVLSDLNTAIRVNETLSQPTGPIYTRYRSIQRGLGQAVRVVHLIRSQVPDAMLQNIRDELLHYEWIFSTSYDLLLYWAMGCGGSFAPFVDHFRGAKLEFDPDRADVHVGQVPVYFLHGALHLVVGGSGVTWKLRRREIQSVLDQFGEPIDGDPQARPLLVTEGTARDKLRAIDGNVYLAHSLQKLRSIELPVVVFGSSLGAQDDHLVDAINEHPGRAVAVSLLPGTRRTLAQRQADIYARLETDELWFFNAMTHPLGYPSLSVPRQNGL
ncbi:MAG TPA: DUF4917 family protein [Solirubrobacteraceae bacterium]|jgi:hypothetical protein|nr:DUF4917 family protein [Solirubrobacteraceae bacterium]